MRRALKIIAIFAVLTFISSGLFGLNKIRWKEMDWQIYVTDHFKIYYYKGEELLAKMTAVYAEEAYENSASILDYRPKNPIPLFIYANHMDFTSTNITLSPLTEGTGGFTEPYKNRVVLPGTGSLKQLRQVIYHEVTHAVQFSIIYGDGMRSYNVLYKDLFTPLWVMEGMAEYAADDMGTRGEMVLRDAVINNRVVPLDLLEGFDHLDEVYLAYKEAQSVFVYMSKHFGRSIIPDFIKSAGEETGMDAVYKKVVKKDFEGFSKDWMYYLKKKYWAQTQGRDKPEAYGPRLTESTHENIIYNQAPSYSPDGKYIAFYSTRGGTEAIYLMRPDGKDARQVFSGYDSISTDGFPISWGSDSKTLYFSAVERGKKYIYKGNTDGGGTQRIEIPSVYNVYSPSASPDDRFISFTGSVNGFTDIFVYEAATGKITNMTNNVFENNYPGWSPDGNFLIFTEERDDYSRIAVIDLKTGKKSFLTKPAKFDYEYPRFISNGEILYTSDKNGIFNIYTMKVPGGAEKQVTNVINGIFYPSFSQDYIAYSYYEDACENIYKYLFDRDRSFEALPLVYDERFIRKDEEKKTAETAPAAKPKPEVTVNTAGTADDKEFKDLVEAKAGDTIKKNEDYSTFITPDLLFALFGYGTDTGLIGGGYITASDMLGNHNLALLANFIPGYFAQFDLQYLYMSLPFDLGFDLFYYQNVYQLFDSSTDLFLSQLDSTQYGGTVSMKYPLSLFSDITLSFQTTRVVDKYTNTQTNNSLIFEGDNSLSILNLMGIMYVYDHSAWRDFWPYSGEVITLYAEMADKYFGGTKTYDMYEVEVKKYFDLSPITNKNMSLSLRFLFAMTDGPDKPDFLFGGMDTLRGLTYGELSGDKIGLINAELRYTLAKNMNFKLWPLTFIMIKNIKLVFFNDIGFVRTGTLEGLTNEEMKNGIGFSFIIDTFLIQRQYMPLKLEVAKRTDIGDDKWKFYFSIATGF